MLKKLIRNLGHSLAGKKVLETEFDGGNFGNSFQQSFFVLPIGFIHIQVKYWDDQQEMLRTDNCYGTGISRMFDRVRDLVNLRGRGVVTVAVEPYEGEALRKYLDSTWNRPEVW